MNKDQFVIGVDYGTDSVRPVLINATNGNEIAIWFYLKIAKTKNVPNY